jgi:hypothetical protein
MQIKKSQNFIFNISKVEIKKKKTKSIRPRQLHKKKFEKN